VLHLPPFFLPALSLYLGNTILDFFAFLLPMRFLSMRALDVFLESTSIAGEG